MFKKEIVAGKGESIMLINEYYEEVTLEESSEESLMDAGEYQQF